MCGIAGVIKVHDPADGPPPPPLEAIPEDWLDILDESIKHRGPDGQGRFRDRAVRDDGTVVDVALVHRRLSIIDHEGGHQPMVHDGERLRPDLTYQPGETPIVASEVEPDKPLVAVVFNGCIYNHRELRKELEGQGYVFETDHSDTEVLVHGWRAWHGRLQDRIDSMHAVLIWDSHTGQLAKGRDLPGEKPLCSYTLDATGAVLITSNVSGLIYAIQVADPGDMLFDSQFPEGARWIQYGWGRIVPTSWIYQAIPNDWQLFPSTPAGEFIVKRPSHKVASRSAPFPSISRDLSLDAQTLESMLQRCLKQRVDADVPVGVFLSGGIDSALIASITHKLSPEVKAFTVRMTEPRHDESQSAAETAKHIGIEHHVLECDALPSEDLVYLIEQLGLPFGDSSLLPTYWVSKAAHEHVRVALSGDGGDELFGGYRRHTIAPALNKWQHLLKLIPTSVLNQRRPGNRSTYLARLATAARFSGYSELLAIFPTPLLRELVQRPIDWRDWPIGSDTFRPVLDPLREDFMDYLPEDLLRKSDTASMAAGLEVRAPFLAKELVDAALRTPLNILMPNGERKGLLKQVARKYLPDHIVDRPKQGFAIPIGEWFRSDYGGMRQLLYDHLHSADPFPGLAEAGVELNMKFVEQMLREHDAAGEKSINPWRGRDHSQRLYMLLVLSIWAKWLQRVRKGEEKAHA